MKKNILSKAAVAAAFFMGLGVAVAADMDGDGVTDARDACPYTLPGTPVDVLGCGLDADADGVEDARDLCPGVPQGEAGDETGCGKPLARLVLHEVYKWGRTRLYTGERKQYVQQLRRWLKRYGINGDKVVLVKVVTDNAGCEMDNLKLAWLRALDFRKLVIEAGIAEAQVLALGLGERYPLSLAHPTAHDRRVIVEIRRKGEMLPKGAGREMPQAVAMYKRRPGHCPGADWR